MLVLDACYKKADLSSIVRDIKTLYQVEQEKLSRVLENYKDLFDGMLGTFKTKLLKLDLKPGEVPYQAILFQILMIHKETLKKELNWLCKIGILCKCLDSQWASPSFIIPKKNGTVQFFTDLQRVNKKITRKVFPIPKINDLMQKLEGFTWVTALDLNMGYYHICLDPDAQKVCYIAFTWGKYQYLHLPMGMNCTPDVFQEQMCKITSGLDFVKTYLDDLLMMTPIPWTII